MSARADNTTAVPIPPTRDHIPTEQHPRAYTTHQPHGQRHTSAVPRTISQHFGDAPVGLNATHEGWTLRDDATYVPTNEYRSSLEAASVGENLTRSAPGMEGEWPRQHGNAGKAAHLANHQHRPVEVWKPESGSASAGKAATLAARNHKTVEVWHPNKASFASTAATLAHQNVSSPTRSQFASSNSASQPKMIGPALAHLSLATPSSSVPKSQQQNFLNNQQQATVRRAASLSVTRGAKDIPRAPDRPRVRAMDLSHVQEAATEAAARRLALLDQELANNAEMRRRNSVGAVSAARSGLRSGAIHKSASPSRVSSTHINMKPKDYVNLLDVAKRNVDTRMTGLDQEVAMKNGLPYRKDWEEQALRIVEARKRAEAGGQDLTGKIDLGGGKFVDAEVINAMAARNVQPLIDEVNELAAEARAKQAEEKAELERKKHEKQVLDERHRQTQQELKKAKAIEKAEATRIKNEEKQEKKRIQAEEKERQAIAARIAETHPTSSAHDEPVQAASNTALTSTTDELSAPLTNKPTEKHKSGGLKGLLHKLRPSKAAPGSSTQTDIETFADSAHSESARGPELAHPTPVRPIVSGPAIDVRSEVDSAYVNTDREDSHVPEVVVLDPATELHHPRTQSLVSSPSSSSVERLEQTVQADEVSISSGSVGAIEVGEGVTVLVQNPESDTISGGRPETPLDEQRVWYDTQDRISSPGKFDTTICSSGSTTGRKEVESRFHEVL